MILRIWLLVEDSKGESGLILVCSIWLEAGKITSDMVGMTIAGAEIISRKEQFNSNCVYVKENDSWIFCEMTELWQVCW